MMTPITERSSADALPLIAFTGGGSAGHVTPNLALIEAWESEGGSTIYLGRDQSIEAELLAPYSATPFFKVPSERLRRYFHWANFIMPIIVLWGVVRAAWVLRRTCFHLLFLKGGFVALPVVIGAWLNRIPVVIHESDGSLGLANRLSLPFARVVCVAQPRARSAVNHRDV
jgi:UDP-N-acetylglucosamine--N-acetylmuramyl-(pentapeptide) pyrophosphoryl-undecaprenol N-acetylglucosamine transferase